MPSSGKPGNRLIFLCLLLFLAVVAWKILFLDYRPTQVVPLEGWRVTVSMQATGSGQDINITHFLPQDEPGQRIEDEKFSGDYAKYTTADQHANRNVAYSFRRTFGQRRADFSFLTVSREVRYNLPDFLKYPLDVPEEWQVYLQPEPLIQSDAPEIGKLAVELGLNNTHDAIQALHRIFDHCHRNIMNTRFSGETDAVLTCRLGEASCNGKSRLMVALCRNQGIPARLVGGLILQGREKKTTHQWVEVGLNGRWSSFCPLNGHFALKPESYVAFYRGDHSFFRRTKDIRFDYSFSIAPVLIPRDRQFSGRHYLDITSVWQLLDKSGIPLSTLGIILVIPMGALVTIIFRNVGGIRTYGTFLPALIAYAFLSTGLAWGMLIFFTVIAGGAALDSVVSRLKLLHTPRLTVLMLYVVTVLLAFGVLGIRSGNPMIAHSLLFPLAIHTITIERFFVIAQERGVMQSLTILGWTMVAVAFSYMVMSSLALQMMVIFFPETYLLVLAAAVYLGRWTGLRVSELYRFRGLIFTPAPVADPGENHGR